MGLVKCSSQQLTGVMMSYCGTLGKKATIHQLTTMLATSKNALFPGHNHLLTIGADDPTLWLSPSLALKQ